MAINNKTNADHMLRRALSRDEAPDTELISKLKQQSFKGGTYMKTSYRHRFAAITAATVLLIALSVTALAYTGVLGNLFTAIHNSGIDNPSRQAILDNSYVAEVAAASPNRTTGEAVLELRAYYVDNKEIGFDFTLTGADIPEDYKPGYGCYAFINNLSLEMAYENGVTNVLEDFICDTRAAKIGDDVYDISTVVTFNAPVALGEKARVNIGGLGFRYDYVGGEEQRAGTDLASVVKTVEGSWAFDIEIDDRFKNAKPLIYRPAYADSTAGVVITSVEVYPTACRIEALIDFKNSGLGDPANEGTKGTEWTTAEWHYAKMNMLGLDVCASAGDKVYTFQKSSHSDTADGIVPCWFEIGSMYFDAPEDLKLIFTGYNGNTAEVALLLNE